MTDREPRGEERRREPKQAADGGDGAERTAGGEGAAGDAPRAPSERTLARYLEGLLDADAAAAVERALAASPRARRRLERLRGVLADPVELPPIALPEGLHEVVLARLEGEGLAGAEARRAGAGARRARASDDDGALAPPPDLFARTLDRLEDEGLVDPAPAPLALPPRRSLGAILRLAAALLLTATAAAAAGYALRGERVRVVRAVATGDAHGASEPSAATSTSSARPEVVRVEVPVERVIERVVEREVPVERIVRVEVPVERIVRVEVPVERVVERVVEREVPVEVVVERIVERAAPAPPVAPPSGALAVAAARDAEVWRPARGAWAPLAAGARLEPGDLIRGGARAASVELGGRRLRLATGTYVVRGGSIEPLPDASAGLVASSGGPSWAGARPGATAAGAGDGDARTARPADVAELIARLETGTAAERFAARRALEAEWARLGDPGPGALGTLASTLGGGSAAVSDGPPQDAAAWRAWWARVVQ